MPLDAMDVRAWKRRESADAADLDRRTAEKSHGLAEDRLDGRDALERRKLLDKAAHGPRDAPDRLDCVRVDLAPA